MNNFRYLIFVFFLPSKGDLHVCRKSLRVLYLHNNAIRTTSTLNRLSSLTHLYLQNNCIDEISGLERLPNLRKLYLGMNRIKVFNNLRNMPQLRELHIERQLLKANEEFTFDVDCVAELGVIMQNVTVKATHVYNCFNILL